MFLLKKQFKIPANSTVHVNVKDVHLCCSSILKFSTTEWRTLIVLIAPTWLLRPRLSSMKKKRKAQSGAMGRSATAAGYATKAKPAPERMIWRSNTWYFQFPLKKFSLKAYRSEGSNEDNLRFKPKWILNQLLLNVGKSTVFIVSKEPFLRQEQLHVLKSNVNSF